MMCGSLDKQQGINLGSPQWISQRKAELELGSVYLHTSLVKLTYVDLRSDMFLDPSLWIESWDPPACYYVHTSACSPPIRRFYPQRTRHFGPGGRLPPGMWRP